MMLTASHIHFIFLISEASISYLDLFLCKFSLFPYFQWKLYRAYKHRHVLLIHPNTSQWFKLVHSWLETTPQLTRLSGNSADKGRSSLPTIKVTVSKRGPHSAGQQRHLCGVALTLPTLNSCTAAQRSIPSHFTT